LTEDEDSSQESDLGDVSAHRALWKGLAEKEIDIVLGFCYNNAAKALVTRSLERKASLV